MLACSLDICDTILLDIASIYVPRSGGYENNDVLNYMVRVVKLIQGPRKTKKWDQKSSLC